MWKEIWRLTDYRCVQEWELWLRYEKSENSGISFSLSVSFLLRFTFTIDCVCKDKFQANTCVPKSDRTSANDFSNASVPWLLVRTRLIWDKAGSKHWDLGYPGVVRWENTELNYSVMRKVNIVAFRTEMSPLSKGFEIGQTCFSAHFYVSSNPNDCFSPFGAWEMSYILLLSWLHINSVS